MSYTGVADLHCGALVLLYCSERQCPQLGRLQQRRLVWASRSRSLILQSITGRRGTAYCLAVLCRIDALGSLLAAVM